MIALTQGQREKLIAHNSEKLKGLKDAVKQTAFESVREDLEFEIQSTEIALASLAAQSVAWVFDDDLQDLKKGYIGNLAANNIEPPIDIPIHRLYTAPPVPEIKFPEKLNVGEIYYELTEKYGIDVSLDQLERGLAEEVYSVAVNNFKRLNGLGE